MRLPQWQERPTSEQASTVPSQRITYAETKKFFAVDTSGSTVGTVLRAEKECVFGLRSTPNDVVCQWHSFCEAPKPIDSALSQLDSGGGTRPSSILRNVAAVDAIKDADLWLLLTDGNIDESEVEELTMLAEVRGVIQVPVILLISGKPTSTPDREDISVGISFFTSAIDALILYKNVYTGTIHVIDAKGAFANLGPETDPDLSDWKKLPKFNGEDGLQEELLSFDIDFDADRSRRDLKGVSLGHGWDAATGNALVKVADLLNQDQVTPQDLRNLLQEEAITKLALACKTRGKLNRLRDLLNRHKQHEVVVRLEDRHDAAQIMDKLQATDDSTEKLRLSEQLREAHEANRKAYQQSKDSPAEGERQARETNRLIDRALRIISELEKSSYTADILKRKSNRAMRADKVSDADSELKLAELDISSTIAGYRSECPICCSEGQIMSVALKRLDAVEENTTDYALNFPLAAAHARQNLNIISSQSICYQCALLLEESIYREDILAVIPTVEFTGPNKVYLVHQLYHALTAGLKTGASGVMQLFAAILDQTLETKSWCAKDNVDDQESVARRNLLAWMLHNLLHNCQCRENFNETGDWVQYPQALEWAAGEFREAGLESWIIQYPVAGFVQLMRWYEILDLAVPGDLLRAIRHAKLIHLVIAKMMEKLLKSGYGDGAWTFPFLRILYRDFNAPGVPKDLGQDSLARSDQVWEMLMYAVDGHQWADIRNFLKMCQCDSDAYLIERVQMATFWVLYTQKNHSSPKTFFANLKSREPLAMTVLDTTSTFLKQAVQGALLSIFCQTKRGDEAFILHDAIGITPFMSPYGPSVLRCGQPGCDVKFYHDGDLQKENLNETIRAYRAKHLSEVFAAKDCTFASQTGLPETTAAPTPPSAHHNTLHISTARTWARLNHHERWQVMDAVEKEDFAKLSYKQFVADAQQQICGTSHKGDIYSPMIESQIQAVLPSFVAALKTASRHLGIEDQSGCGFEIRWTDNTILWKMKYELFLSGAGSAPCQGAVKADTVMTD
ncbi:MAG: hypothetical protein M1831_005291 [Alyxoria varia]|nr:MAG: hypothetical protein M1831_005291 [Alyxoria varia]